MTASLINFNIWCILSLIATQIILKHTNVLWHVDIDLMCKIFGIPELQNFKFMMILTHLYASIWSVTFYSAVCQFVSAKSSSWCMCCPRLMFECYNVYS